MPEQPTPPPLLMTVGEVARALNVSERTIWRLRDIGVLKAVRIGRLCRFRRLDVVALAGGADAPR